MQGNNKTMDKINNILKKIYKRDHEIDDVLKGLEFVKKQDLIDFIQWHFDRGNLKTDDWDDNPENYKPEASYKNN